MYELPSFVFPDTNTLIEEFSNKLLLKTAVNEEKEITQTVMKTVAELAAARFANSTKKMNEVTVGVETIIYDLLVGKDSFTEKVLRNFGELHLSFPFWKQIGQETREILLDCAQKV